MGGSCSQNGRRQDCFSKFQQVNLQERQAYHQGALGVDGRTILEWTLKKQVSIREIGLIRLCIGIIGDPCKCSVETLGSISHRVNQLVSQLVSQQLFSPYDHFKEFSQIIKIVGQLIKINQGKKGPKGHTEKYFESFINPMYVEEKSIKINYNETFVTAAHKKHNSH